jgi:uncharacterized membrane protein YqgA involved in biofilm formation
VIITLGAFLNALGILLGGLLGLARSQPISARTQIFFRNAIGIAVIVLGLRLAWLSLNGTFLPCLKQFVLAVLAVMLGNQIGRLFGLQKMSNRIGHYANGLITSPAGQRQAAGGFNACVILFCVAPLGWLGAVADGLTGYFWLLAVKALMDGLAMCSFVKMFRWPVALSAIPIFVFLGAISLACFHAKPFLDSHGLTDSITLVAGLVACAVALVIFEVRRVELANFLPALVMGPVLALVFK